MRAKNRKGQMSLEMIIGLVILLVVAAVVIKIFLDRMGSTGTDLTKGELALESFRQNCNILCQRYVDTNFAGSEALAYCEKSFEIDLNKNGKIPGESGQVNAFGVCEDHVYCFNIIECNWGPSEKNRLTPTKCKDIMCDVYTSRQGGDNNTAAQYIATKIEFGSCVYNDPEISFDNLTVGAVAPYDVITLAQWHKGTFMMPVVGPPSSGVHCRGTTG